MPLATYTDLCAGIARWAWRDGGDNTLGDQAFAAAIPEMIALAEARINRELRTAEMETTEILLPVEGVVPLPADFLQPRSVTAGRRHLHLVDPDFAATEYPVAGRACAYSLVGTDLVAHPSDNGEITLVYYARIPALSDANPSNWLLASAPDVYLRASLIEAADWMADTEEVGRQAQLYQRAVDKIQSNDTMARYANVSVRRSGVRP